MKMKDSRSVWFNVGAELGSVCSQKQNFLLAGEKFSSCHQHSFLRSEENVILKQFPTL